MYDVFYNILEPSLKDLKLHYIGTDIFVVSFAEGNVKDTHMDLSNLDILKSQVNSNMNLEVSP